MDTWDIRAYSGLSLEVVINTLEKLLINTKLNKDIPVRLRNRILQKYHEELDIVFKILFVVGWKYNLFYYTDTNAIVFNENHMFLVNLISKQKILLYENFTTESGSGDFVLAMDASLNKFYIFGRAFNGLFEYTLDEFSELCIHKGQSYLLILTDNLCWLFVCLNTSLYLFKTLHCNLVIASDYVIFPIKKGALYLNFSDGSYMNL